MSRPRPDLRAASVAELTARLRKPLSDSDRFYEDVVLELVRRAESGEQLQAQVASEALASIAPGEGYQPGDF